MMPIPPSLAMRIAISLSVTVSILLLTIGMWSLMLGVSFVETSMFFLEVTLERLGMSSTSSKVRPIRIDLGAINPKSITDNEKACCSENVKDLVRFFAFSMFFFRFSPKRS